MSTVTASIEIAATPAEVWDTIMDPHRLDEWVTIHRRLRSCDDGPPVVGYRMDQQLHLRGVSVDVHWTLVECLPHKHAVWQGDGTARSHSRTEYTLSATPGGTTHFDYRNEFHPPLGPFGALASRALVGGIPAREAVRSLNRLRAMLEES